MSDNSQARFALQGKLGEGGMGIVYAAVDRLRHMRVALKRLRYITPSRLYRFKREFRALSDLSHPNVIALYELVSEGTEWLLSMELIEGVDFIEFVRPAQAKARDSREQTNAPASDITPDTRDSVSASFEPKPVRLSALHQSSEMSTSRVSRTGAHPRQPSAGGAAASGGQKHGGSQDAARSRVSNTESTETSIGSLSDATAEAGGFDPSRARPVPPPEPPPLASLVDLGRLRSALGQLASALYAVHSVGVIHCDLKPSNVLVDGDGRVVLMDFGIISEMQKDARHHRSRGENKKEENRPHLVGTPAYMAPEQARSGPLTAAIDWYAFGVMMYIALTGHYPFIGSSAALLMAKVCMDPVPPSAFAQGIPEDLETLCMDLLRCAPEERPGGIDVLRRLELDTDKISADAARASRVAFVGRAAERKALAKCVDTARGGATQCVLVRGASGLGKSRLVAQFLDETGETSDSHKAPPMILSGRCSQRESLPYQGLDGVIDDATLYLGELSGAERAQLLPAQAPLLSRLFPVVRRLPECADGVAEGEQSLAARSEAVAALRELVRALAERQPIVIHIEDLQWSDDDSLDLLVGILRAPPPPRLLIVATVRLDATSAARAEQIEQRLGACVPCMRLDLAPLSVDEQHELVSVLSVERAMPMHILQAFERESGGHPMLLAELFRYAQTCPPGELAGIAALRLEDVIWRRVASLPEPARVLLGVCAVAGEAMPLGLLAAVGGLSDTARERASAALHAEQLVQTLSRDKETWVDVYHDKVREAVLQRLPEAEARGLHSALAAALAAQPCASPGTIADHYVAAGERAQAVTYLLRAAQVAGNALAIARANELYQRALSLLPPVDVDGDVNIGAEAAQESDEQCAAARLRVTIHTALAEGMRIVDRADDALMHVAQATRYAEALALTRELANLHYLRGNLLFPRGDIDGCLREHERARVLAKEACSPEYEARALSGLGDASYLRGRIISAFAYYDQCIDLCREHGLESIEAANLSMRGLTRYYQADSSAAMVDFLAAVASAEKTRNLRAEIVARGGALAIIYMEWGKFDEVREETDRSLELVEVLGAHRFAANTYLLMGASMGMMQRRAEGLALIERGLAVCRKTGFGFVGPFALGVKLWLTDDARTRDEVAAEAEEVLRRGAVSHNYLYFYRFAMEAGLDTGDLAMARRYADALENYTRAQPLPWSDFFIARARALAAYRAGERTPELLETLTRLHAKGRGAGLHVAAAALQQAIAGWGS